MSLDMLFDWDVLFALCVVFLCLVLSAFFSAGETALTAVSRARMLQLKKNGSKRAGLVIALTEQRDRVIGAMLIGNNLVNIAASSFTTSVLLAFFGEVGLLYATVSMTVLIVIFSESLPKTLAIYRPERTALALSMFVYYSAKILAPLNTMMQTCVRAIMCASGFRADEADRVVSPHEELRGALDLLHREGGVKKDDRDMLGGLLDLRDLTVEDVMVHRTKMQSLDADLPSDELLAAVLSSSYTRLPLWRETPDNIVGVLHAKDLLRAIQSGEGVSDVAELANDPWFVPNTRPLMDQLKAFRKRKAHFALIVDEYGEVMGLVTLEDIIEEIVGDISDEFDISASGVRPSKDGSVHVDGSVPIRDLNRAMDWALPDDDATTIAGLVIAAAGVIPEAGQTFTFYGYRFEVIRKVKNKIAQIKIMPLG
jgi:Mg2+/Co2+ transporter CorB